MSDLKPIQRDLQVLEVDLRRLEAEYNLFFAHRLPRPPLETRKRVETMLRKWDGVHISSTADRFRLGSLQARFVTFSELWDRNLRAREEGRTSALVKPEPEHPRRPAAAERVLYVETLSNPEKEAGKLDTLYKSWVEARQERGEDTVPFRRFADLVRKQVERLQANGSEGAAFRVALKEGKVTLSVRGLKGEGAPDE